jgi:hypothetical protein
MSLKGWTVAAGMALPILPNASHAATEANFAAATTGDLIAATPDNAIGTAAVNFCEGFAQGAVLVEMQNMAAFRGPKLFNMPNPPPSRDDALSEFVKWARASPDRMSASSTDGLFRFLSDATLAPISLIKLVRGIP